MDLGYGLVLKLPKEYFNKKWSGWIDVRAGYSIFNFTTKRSGKWIDYQAFDVSDIFRSLINENSSFYIEEDDEHLYHLRVPNHHKIIVEAGYIANPTTIKGYPDGVTSGPATRYSFHATAFQLGLKWSAYSRTKVKVKDSQMNFIINGTTRRLFEFEGGLILPTTNTDLPKSEKIGYYLGFRFPTKLNGRGTIDIGMRSLGYQFNGEDAMQFYIGNIFYLN